MFRHDNVNPSHTTSGMKIDPLLNDSDTLQQICPAILVAIHLVVTGYWDITGDLNWHE